MVGWLLLAFLGVVAVESTFGGDLAWAGFVAMVVVLRAIPPLAYRDQTVMLPWEVVALSALPTFGRAVATPEVTSDLGVYLSVAALALIIAVELDTFTTVKMSVGFAILFVIVERMATAGIWGVARWTLDNLLGTQFLLTPGVDEQVVHDELMIEFVYSTGAGVLAGVVFEHYFRRRAPVEERIPEEVVGA